MQAVETISRESCAKKDMVDVPPQFAASLVRREGRRGQAWLDSLPARIEALLERWRLRRDGPAAHGGLGLVLPVRRDDQACMLKLVYEPGDAKPAARALRAWAGHGAVLLYRSDVAGGALLLERLDTARTTAVLSAGDAFAVAGTLLRRLGVAAPRGLPTLARLAARFRDEAPDRWRRAGRPFPERWIEGARTVASALGPASARHLVHWDLHDDNILAGAREPWLAIDPKVVAGDLEFGVAQLLWRRLDELPDLAAFDEAIRTLCAAAGLDSARARAWTRVRCVDYWLWGGEAGLTEDPKRCRTMLEWLDRL